MTTLLRLESPHAASIDMLRDVRASAAAQAAGIVGFAVLAALGAQIRLYLWEVPITLQTLAVYGSGLYLGWRNGLFSMLLYLLLGMFLPVFAGSGFGPAYVLGAASGGYLLAMPLSALVVGVLSQRWNSLTGSALSMLAGSFVLFTIGVLWLHYAADHTTWIESIDKGWLRFAVFDLTKVLVIAFFYAGTRRF